MKVFQTLFTRLHVAPTTGALLVAIFLSVTPAPTLASDAALDEVYSVTYPSSFYFTDIVAEEKGFFTEQGLKVKFISPQNGVNAVQLMASGQIAFMINDGVLTLLAQSRGLGLTMIGSMYNRSAWNLFVADKDASLTGTVSTNPRGLAALKGKRIGVTGINAGTDLGLQNLLKVNGIDPDKDVRRIGIGLIHSAIGQFENGGIDAYIYGDLAADLLAKNKLAHRFMAFMDADPIIANFVQGGMVASTKWLNMGNNRKIAKRWIAAQKQAIDWIQDPQNWQEAGTLFSTAFGGTVQGGIDIVHELSTKVYPHNLPGMKVPRAEFANSATQLENLGVIAGKTPSYEESVDVMGRE